MNQWPLIISCFKQLYNEQHSEQYSKLKTNIQTALDQALVKIKEEITRNDSPQCLSASVVPQ